MASNPALMKYISHLSNILKVQTGKINFNNDMVREEW